MRIALAAALLVVSWSCREIQPLDLITNITGYQLNGTVTTTNGVPVGGADVVVFYEKHLVGMQPTDTQTVVVKDASKPVDIAVYTPDFQLVRQLFLGYKPVGVLQPAVWSGTDQNNNPVPCGKYLIRYVVDTTIVKFSPVLVEGHVTATTDRSGHFTIPSGRLPVGERFDLQSTTGGYNGTYEVDPTLDIIVRTSTLRTAFLAVDLVANQVTIHVFILQ